ncbi:MAG: hypothetical protein Rhims3KO_36050 [Hyphomicrobiales bacterium]
MESPRTTDLPSGRAKLTRVLRAAKDTVHIDDAVAVLNIGRTEASKLLSRWTQQGWLKRVGPGVYVPVSLDALENQHVLDDPWVLVPALYSPAYIGGWSAAEHWDLTEQIFRDLVVLTAQQVRVRHQDVHGASLFLRHIREDKIFGTKSLWRGRTRVAVSDVHRTIVDMLDDPVIGGGIQHVADCFHAYVKRPDCDPEELISYADRLGNGAVFKRLGFLAEQTPGGKTIAERSRARLTKGNAKLDSALKCPRLVTRWRLWVPQSWSEGRVL